MDGRAGFCNQPLDDGSGLMAIESGRSCDEPSSRQYLLRNGGWRRRLSALDWLLSFDLR